jgi:hypothetical protein
LVFRLGRWIGSALAVTMVGGALVSGAQAESPKPKPPAAAPGAAPSSDRMIGTWSVLSSPSGTRTGDRAEGTTYRFEDAGKVTVAGRKQCAYAVEGSELKIDCGGALMAGKLEFKDSETMVWTVAGDDAITLKKR